MKLATLKDGSRDGKLVVVNSDMSSYVDAIPVAKTLQSALENWSSVSHKLQELANSIIYNPDVQQFDPKRMCSPLPRSYQWADGSAYLNHVELVRKARGATVPDSFFTDPLMYQGGSDCFYAPLDPIIVADESYGIDMEAEVAVIVDDVPMGIKPEQAGSHIKLLMLVNDVSLRNLIPSELNKGFGFFQSKATTAFTPVAITPDELENAWDGLKVTLPLCVDLNGKPFGRANAGIDMTFNFPQLIAHAAKTRHLSAGTIIGSGTVSNKLNGGPGKPVSKGGVGYSCIAEIRMIEIIRDGKPVTPFMRYGDTVTIWMEDQDGQSIFGSIKQTVKSYEVGQ